METGLMTDRQGAIITGHGPYSNEPPLMLRQMIQGPLIQGLSQPLVPGFPANADKIQTGAAEPQLPA
jgi:hypothetical protein